MTKRKSIILIAALLMSFGAMAQNLTSSPYSRYAYGDLNENVPTAYRAMGGVGFGMRSNKAINPSQPASYTACDTLTFMFDIAASASWSRYRDSSGKRKRGNGNLEYVTMNSLFGNDGSRCRSVCCRIVGRLRYLHVRYYPRRAIFLYDRF